LCSLNDAYCTIHKIEKLPDLIIGNAKLPLECPLPHAFDIE
jgi:hypothetical protein